MRRSAPVMCENSDALYTVIIQTFFQYPEQERELETHKKLINHFNFDSQRTTCLRTSGNNNQAWNKVPQDQTLSRSSSKALHKMNDITISALVFDDVILFFL